MSNFHPDIDLLTEFAAGSLAMAPASCVSIHLHHCARCQRITRNLTEVGANFFAALAPFAVSNIDLHATLDKLDEEQTPEYSYQDPANSTPAILQRLMRGDFTDLKWNSINAKLRVSWLPTGDPRYEFGLYHMQAGGRIPQHDHRGMEVTQVLQGGFYDSNHTYDKGDFIVRKPGDVHSLTAVQTEDCYCLLVLDAPLKFTEWRFRWMNPFLKLHAK
jgi:putative transcriptional regulator